MPTVPRRVRGEACRAWRHGQAAQRPSLRGLKLAASATAMKPRARRMGVPHLSLRNIPFRALDKFDFTLGMSR